MGSWFSRGKVRARPVTHGGNRDLFLEVKGLAELKGVIAERIAYYHEGGCARGWGTGPWGKPCGRL